MPRGSWISIVATYLFGVLSVASVLKFIPLQTDILAHTGASPGQFAFLIALLGLPAALCAAPSGALVDRVGPRLMLVVAGLLGVVADLGYWLAPSVHGFQTARVLEGLSLVGVFSAAPTLLMGTTEGRKRIAAMTFWSTYTPTGFSLGLLLGGGFAGTALWRTTFLAQGALLLAVSLIGLALPRLAPMNADRQIDTVARLRIVFGAYRRPPALILAIVFMLIISIGYGASITFPAYLSRAHGIGVVAAAQLVAGANLAMIAGAFAIAAVLTRGVRPRLAMPMLAAGAIASAAIVFWPATPLRGVATALLAWFFFMGGGPALLLAVLPRVAEPAHRGAAAGLLNQASAIATFATPPIWLGLFAAGGWISFVLVIAACWLLGTVLLGTLRQVDRIEPLLSPAAA